MNSFIENLNQWGGQLGQFAWPMLWQSSLLIAFIFALDFLLGRKIRASVRYALWLAVLVKLLLPPTLALPTGAAWWLFHAPPPVKTPAIRNYTVTYDTTPLTDYVPPSIALPPPAPPKLNGAGWGLLAAGAVSAVLLLWLMIRWWQVARMVRGAAISEDLTDLIESVRQQAGLRSKIRLKLVEGRMSPAVCGLFHPVILLPRTLAENLSPAQLRAVLLHEVFHLRRLDVWVNCAQALLQIVYWWHPLLWFANARIRRLREEAVDDAVMLALRDEADSYAPTLLEVAKLAFRRPLLSLGLVGIMESRSALRQRIERLVDFRAPRRAGLTFASLCGICVFSAVALPMGEGPNSTGKSNAPATATTEEQSLTVKVNPEIFFRNLKAQSVKAMLSPTNDWGIILMALLRDEGVDCNPPHGLALTNATGELTTQNTPEKLEIVRRVVEQLNRADGICQLPLGNNPLRKNVLIEGRFYPMSDGEFGKFTTSLHHYSGGSSGAEWWSVPPEQFKQFVTDIEAAGLQPIRRPRIQTGSGIAATLYVGNQTNSLELACKPHVGEGFVDLALEGTVISGAPVNAFTNHVISQASAEDHGGIVLRMANYGGHPGSNLVTVISAEIVTNTARFQERLQAVTKPVSPTNTGEAQNLVQDGKLLYEMGKMGEAGAKLKSALALDPESATAKYYLGLVQTNGHAAAKLTYTGPGRQSIISKLDRIRLDTVSFDGLPLSEVLRFLAKQSKLRDPDHEGINFLINSNPDQSGLPKVAPGVQTIDPATGLPVSPTPADNSEPVNVGSFIVKIPSLTNVRLADVLDAIVTVCDHPIKYTVRDFAVVFSVKGTETPQFFSRTFKVDPNIFYRNLNNFNTHILNSVQSNGNPYAIDTGDGDQGGGRYITKINPASDVSVAARKFFTDLGVNLESPPGKSVFYNDRLGKLFVKATAEDLDTIERALSTLDQDEPQSQTVGTNGVSSADGKMILGVLTDPNFVVVLNALKQRNGVESLKEPEVTTTSGRGVNRAPASISALVSTTNISQSVQAGRSDIVRKLPLIRLERVAFAATPLPDVLRYLSEQARANDPEKQGINFLIHPNLGGSEQSDQTAAPRMLAPLITIAPLTNASLGDVLDAVVRGASEPIYYSIQDFAIVFIAGKPPQPLYSRSFQVDPRTFFADLKKTGVDSNGASDEALLARNFFERLGVNWDSPPGKTFFYGDKLGKLFVKATESDLDTIGRGLSALNQVAPQIHIKARFYEVPKGTLDGLKNVIAVTNPPALSNQVAGLVGILTDKNFRTVLHTLEARSDVENLAEPEVVTTSGRQTQMRATVVNTVITNMAFYDPFTNQDGLVVSNSVVPQTSQVETGPILDVVPYVLSDGYTIYLTLIPSLTEFLGYDTSTNTTAAYNRTGEKIDVPKVLPRFTTQQMMTSMNLWDNQTVIIAGLPETTRVGGSVVPGKPKTNDKELLIFVTATIVDPAGNRVHSDDDLPFAQTGIPSQPK